MIDADTQRSALDWAATREKDPIFGVVGISTNNVHKEVKLLESKYDFIVIDGPLVFMTLQNQLLPQVIML